MIKARQEYESSFPVTIPEVEAELIYNPDQPATRRKLVRASIVNQLKISHPHLDLTSTQLVKFSKEIDTKAAIYNAIVEGVITQKTIA